MHTCSDLDKWIVMVLIQKYSARTRPIPWLSMPWLLASPGHQQPWYWLCKINQFLSSTRMDVCITAVLRQLREMVENANIHIYSKILLMIWWSMGIKELVPSNYLNQWWLAVNWTPRVNWFQNLVSILSGIMFKVHWVNLGPNFPCWRPPV